MTANEPLLLPQSSDCGKVKLVVVWSCAKSAVWSTYDQLEAPLKQHKPTASGPEEAVDWNLAPLFMIAGSFAAGEHPITLLISAVSSCATRSASFRGLEAFRDVEKRRPVKRVTFLPDAVVGKECSVLTGGALKREGFLALCLSAVAFGLQIEAFSRVFARVSLCAPPELSGAKRTEQKRRTQWARRVCALLQYFGAGARCGPHYGLKMIEIEWVRRRAWGWHIFNLVSAVARSKYSVVKVST